MINFKSKLHRQLVEAIEHALSSGMSDRWVQLLKRYPAADAFAAVLDPDVSNRIFTRVEGGAFDEWLLNVRPWLESFEDPRKTRDVESLILFYAWQTFSSLLSDNLRNWIRLAGLPPSGGVLAFVAGLSNCIVVWFEPTGTTVTLTPRTVIGDPKSAFDVWNAIENADQADRGTLKKVLESGHKLVSHRGVLTHVDKRVESKVFGPSIDTLVMAELLAQNLWEDTIFGTGDPGEVPRIALEVGCGSGLLAAELVRHIPSLTEICCIDIDFEAVSCTFKNLRLATSTLGPSRGPNIYLLNGRFEASLLNRRFDLVVCNPPYIPLPPGFKYTEDSVPDYFRAVGDVGLLTEIIKQSPALLSPNGRLLLMVNSLSLNLALDAIPSACGFSLPFGESGLEVLFDVESVLNRADWLKYVVDTGQLRKTENTYFHRLHPIWIFLKKRGG